MNDIAIMQGEDPSLGTLVGQVWNVLRGRTAAGEPRDTRRTTTAIEDGLTPRAIANATANLMWQQRGALTIHYRSGDRAVKDGTDGIHHGGTGTNVIRIPGGITVEMYEQCFDAKVVSPDGQVETIPHEDNVRLGLTWRTVQAEAAMEALGIAMPGQDTGVRPSKAMAALAEGLGAIVERTALQPSTETFEYVAENDGETVRGASTWLDAGGGVFIKLPEDPHGSDAANYRARVMTHSHGVLSVPYLPIHEGLERRKRNSFANALGLAKDLPVHLPMPRGNAQAAYVLRTCREAVARDHDLVDARGTAIEPLVNRHLPQLMLDHANAAATAKPEDLAEIDAVLMRGIAKIKAAVEEALEVRNAQKRDTLRTNLGFIEYRHPDNVPQLETA